MPRHPGPETDRSEGWAPVGAGGTREAGVTLRHRLLVALWPAFLMAGVLEVLVFAVLDPADMRGFSGERMGWSSQAVYTMSFLIFWAVISSATTLTALLLAHPREVNEPLRPDAAGPMTPAKPGAERA